MSVRIPPVVPALLAAIALAAPAAAQQAAPAEDAGATAPSFQEGDVIPFDQVQKLRPYLPEEFWDNRDFFFYEGMKLEIGPMYADYSGPQAWKDATEKFRGQARVGPDDSLENYTAGEPFPMDEIDCTGDPQAGTKIIWNFDYQWGGDGAQARFFYSYWDRGEQLPLYYQGTSKSVQLSNRVEPEVYVPTLRRVRRISAAQRTDAVSGTDFTFDDLRSFSGIVPQYEWKCLGERDIIGPMNSQVKGYPYEKEHNFGPYGLSYADDRWELRKAVVVRMIPKNDDHPYHHKDIYIDKQTLTAMYSFAYDQKEELWKIIWHNKRWSEDQTLTGKWYAGWEGIPEPRDLRIVSDTIVNVQTGTGNRIEFWDSNGEPLSSKGRIRRYIDVGRLTKGR